MGFCAEELRELVIRPTLNHLGEADQHSAAKENLLLGTAARESALGSRRARSEKSGCGIYRIGTALHTTIWDDYLIDYPDLASKVRGLASQHEFLINPHAELTTNLGYATAVAWIIYRRANQPLPTFNDINAMGELWASHFHTRATVSAGSFSDAYRQHVLDSDTEQQACNNATFVQSNNVPSKNKKGGNHLAA